MREGQGMDTKELEDSKKKAASMRGRSNRQRGINFERWLVNKVKHIWPNAQRQLESQQGFGYDLANTGNFRFQCKAYKDYCPISKINEIPDGDYVPVLVTKGDRKKPMAVLPLDELIKLIEVRSSMSAYIQKENE